MRSLLLLGLLLVALPATGQAPPTLAASRVEPGAIQLDGRLDEAAWASAEVATGYVLYQPTPGAPETERTEARVLVDGRAVYVGMRMHDRGAVTAALGRRDLRLASDYASVVLDSYGDHRTAFQFEVNPAGVQRDFLFYDDVREDGSWDAVWASAVSVDSTGWTAELRIPLSQLRYASSQNAGAWGVQFYREVFRTGESASWAPQRPDQNGVVSQFGTLTGMSGLRSTRQLEVVPYAASALTRAPGNAADPFYDETALTPRIGLDLKYGLTSDLTLTATVNPDFGQVEADPAQVNLGGFELFFEERRPFFVEGTDVFSLEPRRFIGSRRPDLLYTRRIGRQPQRTSFVPASARTAAGDDGVVYTDAPQQSTILGAAKVSGRVGRFTVGLLDAATRPEHGRFQAFDGVGALVSDDRALIEPLTNFLVGRARGLVGQTLVGGLLTSVVRDTGDPAIAALLPQTATVVGADVERPLGQQWRLSAQAAGSASTGSESAITDLQTAFPRTFQRPDADYLRVDSARTSLAGWTAEANLLKTDGTHWTGALHTAATSPGFDANALGFQSRADFANVDALVQYSQNSPQGPFQSWAANVSSGLAWTFGGDRIGTVLAFNTWAQFHNFWFVRLRGNVAPRFDDDRLTRGGPIARRDAGGGLSAVVATDSRKRIAGSVYIGGYGNELGRFGIDVQPEVVLRPAASVSVSISPLLSVFGDPRQYVTAFDEPVATATFGTRYVFGQLDQTSVSLEARLDWTFTPDLSLQLYARPYAARGRYSAFKDFDRPGAFRLPEYGADTGTATENADGSMTIDPGDGGAPFTLARDFTVRALQGNAVLRWQYRPGSTLFFVWQQQRAGAERDGALQLGRDVGGLFTDPLTNVFLIKLSYWFG